MSYFPGTTTTCDCGHDYSAHRRVGVRVSDPQPCRSPACTCQNFSRYEPEPLRRPGAMLTVGTCACGHAMMWHHRRAVTGADHAPCGFARCDCHDYNPDAATAPEPPPPCNCEQTRALALELRDARAKLDAITTILGLGRETHGAPVTHPRADRSLCRINKAATMIGPCPACGHPWMFAASCGDPSRPGALRICARCDRDFPLIEGRL